MIGSINEMMTSSLTEMFSISSNAAQETAQESAKVFEEVIENQLEAIGLNQDKEEQNVKSEKVLGKPVWLEIEGFEQSQEVEEPQMSSNNSSKGEEEEEENNPMDLNKDGVVTSSEMALYEKMQNGEMSKSDKLSDWLMDSGANSLSSIMGAYSAA